MGFDGAGAGAAVGAGGVFVATTVVILTVCFSVIVGIFEGVMTGEGIPEAGLFKDSLAHPAIITVSPSKTIMRRYFISPIFHLIAD
jgi:hypothetical protein